MGNIFASLHFKYLLGEILFMKLSGVVAVFGMVRKQQTCLKRQMIG